MRIKTLVLLIVTTVLFSCQKEKGSLPSTTTPPSNPPSDPPVATSVMLKEIVIPNLPSPYYHFDYDQSGKVSFVSFASSLRKYDVNYEQGKIGSMVDNIGLGVHEIVKYIYDNAGRVTSVIYVDVTGVNYAQVFYTYQGDKLVRLERQRLLGQELVVNKIMTFSYYDDGNVKEISDHRPEVTGIQGESTTIDRFEQYDNKINVDGFSLMHNDFFDNLVLLPGVQLQKNNPGKETFTGDGLNFAGTYVYTYNDHDLPLTKTGHFTFTSGTDAGQAFVTNSTFSYYQ
jgi:hypothetical protein